MQSKNTSQTQKKEEKQEKEITFEEILEINKAFFLIKLQDLKIKFIDFLKKKVKEL